MKAAPFPPITETDAGLHGEARTVGEAAPARARIRVLMILMTALFLALGARAVQLAITPLSGAPAHAEGARADVRRADLTDRNGVLLATTAPGYALTAVPRDVWNAPAVARELAAHLPDFDVSDALAKLQARGRDVVFLRRGLTETEKDEIFALGLPGIKFRNEQRRVYPQGDLAAHTLGGVNGEMAGDAGIELGLDKQIRRAGAAGAALRLSLDVRIQHALEAELRRAVAATAAQGGAGIILDGRTGEVLAIASAPDFDANAPPPPNRDDARLLDRASGAPYEMGSTLKPFTIAMALDAGVTRPDEVFDLSKPLEVQGHAITDYDQLGAATPLPQALASSSNIMAATLALRLGPARQRAALARLGLLDSAGLELPQSERAELPQDRGPLTTATIGFGHGLGITLAALAGAYTVFANDGARVRPTLLAHAQGDEVTRIPVFTPRSTRAVLAMMRAVVTEGTGKRAAVAGLDVAGKTGTADMWQPGGYSSDRMLSSFAAIFPAHDPHYVMVVALDQPQRVAAFRDAATGGAVAAPLAARVLERVAPLLGLTSDGGESP